MTTKISDKKLYKQVEQLFPVKVKRQKKKYKRDCFGALIITAVDSGGNQVNASIYVDEEEKGKGKVALKLPAGQYKVEFGSLEGYATPKTKSTEVEITPRETLKVMGIYRKESKFEVTLENLSGGGSAFTIQGSMLHYFPDGVPDSIFLHVILDTESNNSYLGTSKTSDVEVAFFGTLVYDNHFYARKVYANQVFAPITHSARIELMPGSQKVHYNYSNTQERADWVEAQYGHIEGWFSSRFIVDKKDPVEVGTSEEQKAFEKKTLEDLRGFIVKVRTINDAILASVNSGVPADTLKAQLIDLLRPFSDEFSCLYG